MMKWEEAGFKTQGEWIHSVLEVEGLLSIEETTKMVLENRDEFDIGIYDENDRLIGIKPEEDDDWDYAWEDKPWWTLSEAEEGYR